MKTLYRDNKGLHRWLFACGAVLVLFEESEELAALLGLVGHRKICLSAMFSAWNLTL